jgi:hypothetical protein
MAGSDHGVWANGITPPEADAVVRGRNRPWLDLVFASTGTVVSDASPPVGQESNQCADRRKSAEAKEDRRFASIPLGRSLARLLIR